MLSVRPPVARPVAARRPIGHWLAGPKSVSNLWPSGFDFWPKSLEGERSIRSVSGRRTPGHRAYFGAPPITAISLKLADDRWETAGGIGGSSVSYCRDAARKSSPISPRFFLKSTGDRLEIDKAPPRHRWGSTVCSTSPKNRRRCLNSSGDRAGY